MTDIFPYGALSNEHAITHSIRKGEPPADISAALLPDFVRFILEGCWQQDPAARCDMVWHRTALSARTTSPFMIVANIPPSKVPLQYKTERDGWNVIRNPTVVQEYDFEFGPRVNRNV